MIGNAKWFARRKYGGWGLTPVTWQGWVYVALMVAPLIIVPQINAGRDQLSVYFLFGWALIFAVDIILMMKNMKNDEREIMHEAFAERNALWAVIAVLTIGVAYQVSSTVAAGGNVIVDPVIIAALLAGAVAKGVTNYWLDRKD
jgi:cobalamin synthase